MSRFDEWLSELAYTDFPAQLFVAGDSAGARPYASEIEEVLDPLGGICASAVFCVGELPTVCLIDGSKLTGDRTRRIEQIRQRVWNQNLISVVLVLDPEKLAAYSVNEKNAVPNTLTPDQVNRRGRWSAYEIESGFVKDRLSTWFDPQNRVDQQLLNNLRGVVDRLTKHGLSGNEAEALMAQVIFLCYLEQRGIVGNAYRERHSLKLLEQYVVECDGKGVDRLLERLGKDFNGDFLSSSDGGAPRWSALSKGSFSALQHFLDAVDFETGQGSFWHYDFSHIPVEMISGIYETLLKDRQGTLGAYYTPRHLANLVTEQALESFAKPEKCTVYDGACGSGILLTTAFRKMLRHAEVRGSKRLKLQNRIALMKQCIFGNDIDETACWITAFSLYLSLLEGLDPTDISSLQADENLKLPRLVGAGLNIQKGKNGDFFSKGNPFAASHRFDVFLCNPPWRESDDDEKPLWEEWCRSQKPPYPIGRRQIAAGFAYKALQSVRKNGVIALILPLNLVIGATKQSCAFRQRWLVDAKIERIINLGDVRRLLFHAAKHPCAVVRLRPRSRAEGEIPLAEEAIEYWTPKTDVSLALGRLALHATDRKLLSARDVYEKPYVLISSYWGEKRDLDLLVRLGKFGSLGELMASRKTPWLSGKGFHAANSSNKDRALGILKKLEFLGTDRLPVDQPMVAKDAQLQKLRSLFSIVASPGGKNGKLYSGPRVLFPDGLSESYTVHAVYTDRQFAFQSSIGAIGGPKKDAELLKFLTFYLRSPLATYLMVMTGYSVIGERPRVALDDIEEYPFCAPEQHPHPKRARKIIDDVASKMDALAKVPEWQRHHAYDGIKDYVDKKIFDYFELTENDRILVTDIAQFVATSIQPPDYDRISTPLLQRPLQDEFRRYASILSAELGHRRENVRGAGSLNVRVIAEGSNGFFGAVRVAANSGPNDANDSSEYVASDAAFLTVISELQLSLRQQAALTPDDELFKVANVMVFTGDVFYYLKPLRRRFWMSKIALSDADHIVRTIQAAAWGSAK